MNFLIEPSRPVLEGIRHRQRGDTAFRILVVDDEADIRNFITEVLSDGSYIADGAANGMSALKLLEQRRYDVLLTDYNMPGISGADLISAMKARGLDLPTILMTGQRETLLTCHPDIQVNAFLEKPFIIEQLLQALSQVLHPENSPMPANMIELATVDHEARRTTFF